MNSYRMYNLSRTPIKSIDRSYDQFMPRKFQIDLQSFDCSRLSQSADKRSQTSTNFWTEQKTTTSNSYLNNSETNSFEEEPSYKRIELTLNKYKFSNNDIKPSLSTKKFDDLHEKINSHLNKISQFLASNKTEISNNKTEIINNKFSEKQSLLLKEDKKPEPKQESSSYLPMKSRKPLSVNFTSKYSAPRPKCHHFTSFAHYLFSNGMTNPLQLKQYLRQLKIDLADRDRMIKSAVGRTQYWQNVWLGPKERGKVKTLVLDLDETLIHSSFDQRRILKMHEPRIPCSFDFRPFLKEFMEKCDKVFEIVIFTASEERYANALVNRIKHLCNYKISIKKILDRKFLNSLGQKDLSIIKDRDLKDIIFIDNLALSFAKGQLDNGIPILEWTGDSRDKELKKIVKFLLHAEKSDDVRETIKEAFNLDKFKIENIEWDALEAEFIGSPVAGKCSF